MLMGPCAVPGMKPGLAHATQNALTPALPLIILEQSLWKFFAWVKEEGEIRTVSHSKLTPRTWSQRKAKLA